MREFRLFLSSPADATVERRRAEDVASRINGEFVGLARFAVVRWETENYKAHETFQSQIPPADSCDVVIGILRWRLGVPLPATFPDRLPDGESYPSGTAYELLTSIAKRHQGAELPDVYVFRYMGGAPLIEIGEAEEDIKRTSWAALGIFIARWFQTPSGEFQAAFNSYATEDDFEHQLESLLRKWLSEKVTSGRIVPWPETKRSPFRGLGVFGTKHAPVFFGRSADVRKATELWRSYAAKRDRLLMIIGASGAGKSSLARAGLIPRLTTPGVVADVDRWRVAVMRPGDSSAGPFASFAAALFQTDADLASEEMGRGDALPELASGDFKTPSELAAVLEHADTSGAKIIVGALDRVAAGVRTAEKFERAVRCHLVLLVDQLDELFVPSVSSEARDAFARLLSALLATGQVWVLVTLRADLYPTMLKVVAWKDLKDRGASYDLVPPGPVELAEIVREPAKAAALTFETDPKTGDRLDERLLREADRPDMLPLVQLALSKLWDARVIRGSETMLPIAAFEVKGGVKGIIEEAGETALKSLSEVEQGCLPPLIRRLAELSKGSAGAQGTLNVCAVALDEAASTQASKRLVDALVAARLLTLSDQDGSTTVRLAHQRVLSDWERAARIVSESAEFYRVREEVEAQRQRWQEAGKRRDLLLGRGLPLAEAQAIASRYGTELSSATAAYIDASRRRATLSQAMGWAAAAVFAIVAVLGGIEARLAFNHQAEADRQRRSAERNFVEARQDLAGSLVALSQLAIRISPIRAAKLALASWPRDRADRTMPKLQIALVALSHAVLQLTQRQVLQGQGAVKLAAFSPTGARIITGSAKAQIWDATTGKEIAVLGGRQGEVLSATFSDGTRVVTASYDRAARIWDAATGTEVAVLRGHKGRVDDAAFSPDGTRVVTVSRDRTAIWDMATGKRLKVLHAYPGQITRALFSPDGTRVLTMSFASNASVWDAASGEEIAVLRGHEGSLMSITFSPDGSHVATTSEDRTARLWELATGKETVILRGHENYVYSAAFSPDGARVVTASKDKAARVWDVATGKEIAVLRGHEDEVNRASFSPDGTCVITASDDGTARVWDAETGKEMAILRGHEGHLRSAAFSYDGSRVVTASDDATARVWDLAASTALIRLRGHQGAVYNAVFSPSGAYVATTSKDKTARIWLAMTGREIAVLRGHEADVMSFAFSPDGTHAVTASLDGTARVWDLLTNKDTIVLRGREGSMRSAVFSPDGTRVFTVSQDGTERIWLADTGAEVAKLRGRAVDVVRLALSPDGSRVVTASLDGTARIREPTTGKEFVVFRGHKESVIGASFSSDGTRVVTASNDGTARVWDTVTGKEIAVLRGHDGLVWDASFSPDRSRVVTASVDQTARIWDLVTAKEIAVLRGHRDRVSSATFSPDGTRVVTASWDGTARIWDVSKIPKGDIFHVACKWLPDKSLADIAQDYGLPNLEPICRDAPPPPDPKGEITVIGGR